MKLLYAFYQLLFVAGFMAEIVRTGEVPAILADIVLVVAAGLSVGSGMAFPRFEATAVTRSVETVGFGPVTSVRRKLRERGGKELETPLFPG